MCVQRAIPQSLNDLRTIVIDEGKKQTQGHIEEMNMKKREETVQMDISSVVDTPPPPRASRPTIVLPPHVSLTVTDMLEKAKWMSTTARPNVSGPGYDPKRLAKYGDTCKNLCGYSVVSMVLGSLPRQKTAFTQSSTSASLTSWRSTSALASNLPPSRSTRTFWDLRCRQLHRGRTERGWRRCKH
jgi:hypothetical protein